MTLCDKITEAFSPTFYGPGDMNTVLGGKFKVIGDQLWLSSSDYDKVESLLKRWKYTRDGNTTKDGDDLMTIWKSGNGKQKLIINVNDNDMKMSVTFP